MIDSFIGRNFFLSNFFLYPVTYEEITYPSAMHAFQAGKTDYIELRKKIIKLPTTYEAKVYGRNIPEPKDWAERRFVVMNTVVRAKFATPLLAAQLLATGNEELVNENYFYDTFWGTCNGKGANHLGKILMDVRKELRAAC